MGRRTLGAAGLAGLAGLLAATLAGPAAAATPAATSMPVSRAAPSSSLPAGVTSPEARLVAALRASRASAPYRFGTAAFNKWYARGYLARVQRGNATQFACLDRLWHRESRWSHRAMNPSGRYLGIPQMTRSTIRSMGFSESGFRANPEIQVQVGLRYIKGRYGTPCSAWAHSQRTGWY